MDLEHWAAFQDSYRLIDVHQAYLETVSFRNGGGVQSNVHPAVCSRFATNWFGATRTWCNQLGWLHLDGHDLRLTIETTRNGHEPELEISLEHQLA